MSKRPTVFTSRVRISRRSTVADESNILIQLGPISQHTTRGQQKQLQNKQSASRFGKGTRINIIPDDDKASVGRIITILVLRIRLRISTRRRRWNRDIEPATNWKTRRKANRSADNGKNIDDRGNLRNYSQTPLKGDHHYEFHEFHSRAEKVTIRAIKWKLADVIAMLT